MYCSECGNKLSDGAKYCSNCGARIMNDRFSQKNARNFYYINDVVKDGLAISEAILELSFIEFMDYYFKRANIIEKYDLKNADEDTMKAYYSELLNLIYNIDISNLKKEIEPEPFFDMAETAFETLQENIELYNSKLPAGVQHIAEIEDLPDLINNVGATIYGEVYNSLNKQYDNFCKILTSIQQNKDIVSDFLADKLSPEDEAKIAAYLNRSIELLDQVTDSIVEAKRDLVSSMADYISRIENKYTYAIHDILETVFSEEQISKIYVDELLGYLNNLQGDEEYLYNSKIYHAVLLQKDISDFYREAIMRAFKDIF